MGLTGAPKPLDQQLLRQKRDKLFGILESLGSVVVAYSGGTDSAFLAWAAGRALGENAVAITADSPSIPESHKQDAAEYARVCGFRHETIPTHEFDNPDYSRNEADRCFHCKGELFTRLAEIAAERGIPHIAYGVNKDDLGDYRPGQEAARQHNIQAPLLEADLTKAEIREIARQEGLPFWDRPASACLSSRIPYGTPVTPETVKKVELGEEALKSLGFRQFRVRYHGELVRIEIGRQELEKALTLEMAQKLTALFKEFGFLYVTLDLEGYRQGSMNEVLRNRSKAV